MNKENLEKLIERTNNAVYLTINENKNYKKPMLHWLDEIQRARSQEIPDETKTRILKNNSIVELEIFGETGTAFTIYEESIDKAVSEADRILDLFVEQ